MASVPSNPHSQPFALLHGERFENYCPGGLHPVRLGDTFKDGRYSVVRKLGHGAFSTVWLVRDVNSSTFVALKIGRSDSPCADREIGLHELLLTPAECEGPPVQDHVATVLDSFKHTGPNGQHTCLVFQPLGPNISMLFGEGRRTRLGIPYEDARSIIKQLLLGLHSLHQRSIAYSDMNFGNILRAIELSWLGDNLDLDDLSSSMGDRSAFMHEDQPLAEFVDRCAPVTVKLSDLGAAFPFSDPPAKPIVPVALRAPELVLGCDFGHKIDIWSFGCLVFEILTGSQLFGIYPLPYMSDAEVDDRHILEMIGTVGQLPPQQFAQWTRGSRYFNKSLELFRSDTGKDDTQQVDLYITSSLETQFMQRQPPQMSHEESRLVISFLRRALKYDPSDRPTTEQLLADPWILSIVDD